MVSSSFLTGDLSSVRRVWAYFLCALVRTFMFVFVPKKPKNLKNLKTQKLFKPRFLELFAALAL